jgi:hypothetical protein
MPSSPPAREAKSDAGLCWYSRVTIWNVSEGDSFCRTRGVVLNGDGNCMPNLYASGIIPLVFPALDAHVAQAEERHRSVAVRIENSTTYIRLSISNAHESQNKKKKTLRTRVQSTSGKEAVVSIDSPEESAFVRR